MSSTTVSPIKVKITRAWTDLAPKLVTFLATGLTGSALVAVAAYFGIVLDVGLASALVVAISSIAGYFVKDKATIDAGAVTPGTVAVITAMYDTPLSEEDESAVEYAENHPEEDYVDEEEPTKA